jgi:hypothetical protein
MYRFRSCSQYYETAYQRGACPLHNRWLAELSDWEESGRAYLEDEHKLGFGMDDIV